MQRRAERRRERERAPMAYRMSRQRRPSLLRAYTWRAIQGAARTLPSTALGLTQLELTLHHLKRDLDGLKLLHITDLHLTAGTHPADEILPLIENMTFDLAAYTGDLADDAEGCVAFDTLLAQIRPRLGSFAVLGNHDYYYYRHASGEGPTPNDLAPLLHTLEAHEVCLLSNRSCSLLNDGLTIVGVDDPALGRDQVADAFAGLSNERAMILLAHSPDVLLRLGRHRPGLLLAGHTHGGQLRLPGVGALASVSVLPRRYAMGTYVYNDIPTFVSRGVGTSGAPARLNCPPEIAVVTLRAPSSRRHHESQ